MLPLSGTHLPGISDEAPGAEKDVHPGKAALPQEERVREWASSHPTSLGRAIFSLLRGDPALPVLLLVGIREQILGAWEPCPQNSPLRQKGYTIKDPTEAESLPLDDGPSMSVDPMAPAAGLLQGAFPHACIDPWMSEGIPLGIRGHAVPGPIPPAAELSDRLIRAAVGSITTMKRCRLQTLHEIPSCHRPPVGKRQNVSQSVCGSGRNPLLKSRSGRAHHRQGCTENLT
jgi:hypothetical protein